MRGILLATTDPSYERTVNQAFGGTLNGKLQLWLGEDFLVDARRAVTALVNQSPDVIAIGPGLSVPTALELAAQLDRSRPEISLLLVAEPTSHLWEMALRSGVRDVLPPDAPPDDVRAAFERAIETAAKRRANLGADGGPDDSSARTVITVLSPKGGSGKTMLATNLAVGLATHAPDDVCIVDLDLQFGDVGSALGLEPEHTLANAGDHGDLDPMALKVLLTPHPSRLFALCAPQSPVESEHIPTASTHQILQLLTNQFRYLVIDTAAGVSEHTLTAVEASTDLLFVCTMDVQSVRSLRKVIVTLDNLNMTSQRRHFVLNRAHSRVGLEAADIERTVGLPIEAAVPSSRAVPLSMNQGAPLLASERRSPVSRQLHGLVGRVAGQATDHKRRSRRIKA